jgi:hypothetical protein
MRILISGWVRFHRPQKYGDCTETSQQQRFSFQPEGRGRPGDPAIFGEVFVVYESVVPGIGDFDLQAIQPGLYRMRDVCLEGCGPDRATIDAVDADGSQVVDTVQPKGGWHCGSIGDFEMIQVGGRA